MKNSVRVREPAQDRYMIHNGYFMRMTIKKGCLIVKKWLFLTTAIYAKDQWEYAFTYKYDEY